MTVRPCSVARALAVVGERWALLVVREVGLGVRRFTDIQARTGAPRSVLADRLASLVQAGVLEVRHYREPGARARPEYRLTDAGRDLQPVLSALMDWGDRHLPLPEGPPMLLQHRECGAAVHARLLCEQGHEVTRHELEARPQR